MEIKWPNSEKVSTLLNLSEKKCILIWVEIRIDDPPGKRLDGLVSLRELNVVKWIRRNRNRRYWQWKYGRFLFCHVVITHIT